MNGSSNVPQDKVYDVVIVGGGISGAIVAKQLGLKGHEVLILESGDAIPDNRNAFMHRFYSGPAKVPEVPYTPELFDADPQRARKLNDPTFLNAPRATVLALGLPLAKGQPNKNLDQAYLDQQGPLPFSSSYERVAGGTTRHWLGTSLRNCPNDFRLKTAYGQGVDWPIGYDDLAPWYAKAEDEIGVSANKADQEYLGITFAPDRQYPMPGIVPSVVDAAVTAAAPKVTVDGIALEVRNTPAGRNSRPFGERPACAGNTNCIPICPIQAKYDASVTLNQALDTGKVQLCVNTVATQVVVGAAGAVEAIEYVQYDPAVLHDAAHPNPSITGRGKVRGKRFVIAAHAIETPKLLLNSTNDGKLPSGVANGSGQVGKNLMDHPLYLAWAATSEPVYGYRGPLATSGIENVRDGAFRKERGAFRVEIGNEGWNFAKSDPYNTTLDMVLGLNQTRLNPPNPYPQKPVSPNPPQFGVGLAQSLNAGLTRQFRVAMLIEQSPEETNAVTLSTAKDWLGIPRPKITYGLSEYTKRGFVAAAQAATDLFKAMGATEYTEPPDPSDPTAFEDPSGATVEVDGKTAPRLFKLWGSGHVVGTYRMGSDAKTSVVDKFQRSWDHKNLFLVGSGVFPTVATANPTLTIAALAFWAADTLVNDLAPGPKAR